MNEYSKIYRVSSALAVIGVVLCFAWLVPGAPSLVGILGMILCGTSAVYGTVSRASTSSGAVATAWWVYFCVSPFWTFAGVMWFTQLRDEPSARVVAVMTAAHLVHLVVMALVVSLLTGPTVTQVLRRGLDACMIGGAVALTVWALPIADFETWGSALAQSSHGGMWSMGVAGVTFSTLAFAAIHVFQRHLRGAGTLPMGFALIAAAIVTFIVTLHPGSWAAAAAHYVPALWAAPVVAAMVASTVYGVQVEHLDRAGPAKPTFWPYLPVGIAAVVVIFSTDPEQPMGALGLHVMAWLVVVAFSRQYLAVRDSERLMAALSGRDAQLRFQAGHDHLTGVSNRDDFTTRLTTAMSESKGRAVIVMIVGLDGFKAVNDRYGHSIGDQLLVQVSERIEYSNPGSEAIARLSGDEFAVLLAPSADPLQAAEQTLESVRQPFHVLGHDLMVTCSIGVVAWVQADGPVEADELLTRADIAMYAVKNSGRDGFQLYGSGSPLGRDDDRVVAPALAAAIDGGSLETHYQPVVAASDGQLLGFEALSRWTWKGEAVPAGMFIATASRVGLLDRLTQGVLERTCKQLAAWNERFPDRRYSVAVNLGGYSLRDQSLPDRILKLVDEYRLDHGQLVLEVTESVPIQDIERARETLLYLRERGIRLSLDDFGAGYNGISQMLRLPVNHVKLDRSIVDGVHREAESYRVVQAMTELAQFLEMAVVAEGVESADQLAVLRSLGVDWVQGYVIGRPQPAAYWEQAMSQGTIDLLGIQKDDLSTALDV